MLFFFVLSSFMHPSTVGEDIQKIDMMLEEEEMAMIFLPLSNGEATLFKHASGKTVLFNTGAPHTERELKRWFEQFQITEIDELILTSDDEPYVGNVEWIKRTYDPKIVDEWQEQKVYEPFPHFRIQPLYIADGDVTMSLQYGQLRLLYMAHADNDVERKLMTMPLNDVNILKIAHFGINDYPRTSFLKHVDPQVAIIFKKHGSWPSERLLERLYAAWIDCYETNRFGVIVVKCNLEEYDVMTF
ncbi:ComEC/Rec2 family competence protein [Anoxybacillus sp. TBDG-1]